MSQTPGNETELQNLLDGLIEERLSPAQMQRLESLLTDSTEVVDAYLEQMQIHALLQWRGSGLGHDGGLQSVAAAQEPDSHGEFREGDVEQVLLEPAEKPAQPPRNASGAIYAIASNYVSLSLMTSAVVMAIIVLALGLVHFDRKANEAGGPSVEWVAEITSAQQSSWRKTSGGNLRNRSLLAGDRLELIEGLVEITYSTGVQVVLEGPATYEILGSNSGALQLGKLFARVEAAGFMVQTPGARVVDFGTEFGVIVSDAGGADVRVFDGTVEVGVRLPDGEFTTKKLRGGEGVQVKPGVHTIAPIRNQTERFKQVRSFARRNPLRDDRLIVADIAADYRPGVPSRGWMYLKSSAANGGTESPLVWSSPADVGGLGNLGYGGGGGGATKGNLPAISNRQIFDAGAANGLISKELTVQPDGNEFGSVVQYAILRWTATAADLLNGNEVVIAGSFRNLAANGDGVDVYVYHNDLKLFSARGNPRLTQTAGRFNVTVALSPGDTIDFVVGPNHGGLSGDETAITAKIVTFTESR